MFMNHGWHVQEIDGQDREKYVLQLDCSNEIDKPSIIISHNVIAHCAT